MYFNSSSVELMGKPRGFTLCLFSMALAENILTSGGTHPTNQPQIREFIFLASQSVLLSPALLAGQEELPLSSKKMAFL